MIFDETAAMWKLTYLGVEIETGQKSVEEPFRWHWGTEGGNCVIAVAEEIYTTRCFFPARGLDISSVKPIDLLTRQFAQTLADDPVFHKADWLVWISDPFQVELSRWVGFDGIEQCKGIEDIQKTQTRFALAYLFWKGLFFYLDNDERWKQYNARILYLISAWQWFHLIRYLSKIWIEARDTLNGKADEDVEGNLRWLNVEGNLRWLNNELIAATQALQDLIQRVDFRFAVQWLIHQLDPTQAPVDPTKNRGRKERQANFPEVERLIYGMLLEHEGRPQDQTGRWSANQPNAFSTSTIGGNKPVFDPDQKEDQTWELGSVIKNEVTQDLSWQWREVDLHPVYRVSESWNLQSFARLLIRKWLLPRYDFSGALHVVMLLRSYQSKSKTIDASVRSGKWFGNFLVYVIVWAVVLLFDFTLAPILQHTLRFDIWNDWASQLAGGFIFWTLIAGGIWQVRCRFDQKSYQYLLLPRLLGGILVGYAGLVLSADSLVLKNALFAECTNGAMFCYKNIVQAVFLWIAVAGIGWWYFYYECLARVQHEERSKKRAFVLLAVSFAASMSIGLFAISLTTAMEWQSEACKGFALLLCPVQGYFMMGPIGVIDVRQFFVFVPLAMLTGFISQFLFEEKPITASVWEE